MSEKRWECEMRARGRDWTRYRVGRGERETWIRQTRIDRQTQRQTQRQGEIQSLRGQKLQKVNRRKGGQKDFYFMT